MFTGNPPAGQMLSLLSQVYLTVRWYSSFIAYWRYIPWKVKINPCFLSVVPSDNLDFKYKVASKPGELNLFAINFTSRVGEVSFVGTGGNPTDGSSAIRIGPPDPGFHAMVIFLELLKSGAFAPLHANVYLPIGWSDCRYTMGLLVEEKSIPLKPKLTAFPLGI